MILAIKNKIENELKSFILDIEKTYSLNSLSPLLYNNIKEFMSRDGKRVRPLLFVIGALFYFFFMGDQDRGAPSDENEANVQFTDAGEDTGWRELK